MLAERVPFIEFFLCIGMYIAYSSNLAYTARESKTNGIFSRTLLVSNRKKQLTRFLLFLMTMNEDVICIMRVNFVGGLAKWANLNDKTDG